MAWIRGEELAQAMGLARSGLHPCLTRTLHTPWGEWPDQLGGRMSPELGQPSGAGVSRETPAARPRSQDNGKLAPPQHLVALFRLPGKGCLESTPG
jgi:hypothetical protein